MSWGIVAGAAIGAVGSAYAGNKAAKASKNAANTSAGYQMAGLDYLKESEAAPMYYRDQALSALAAEYGLAPMPESQPQEVLAREGGRDIIGYKEIKTGSFKDRAYGRGGAERIPIYADEQEGYVPPSQQSAPASPQPNITEMATNSPLYDAIMGGRDAGEQAIARTSNATGGLRGGQSVSDMATFNRDLNNRALMESRNSIIQGLGSFAGMPSNANAVAGQYNNIGTTLAQGQIAGAQAKQQGVSDALQGIGTGISAYYGSKI